MAANGGKWAKRIVIFVLLAFGLNAQAEDGAVLPWESLVEPPAYMTFDVEGTDWTLYPVVAANDTVIGFFGHMPQELVVGDNVSLLWLTPDNGDGSWSMYGWSHAELRAVSKYMDGITGTVGVLADTGLDVFFDEAQAVAEPENMPFGIAESDPSAPVVAATRDPILAEALISVGAAGAPNLTQAMNLQPVDCDTEGADDQATELDLLLATYSRDIQISAMAWLSEGILDSLEFTGLDQGPNLALGCCFPRFVTVWLAWSPWTCTNPNPFLNGAGVCRSTGCSRTRTGTRFFVWPNCSVTTVGPVTDTQGPQEINGPVNPDGTCAPCP